MTGAPGSTLRGDLRTLFAILRLARVRRRRLVASALLSALADVASLAMAATLLALVRGLVAGGLGSGAFLVDVSELYAAVLAKNGLEYASELVLAREISAATLRIRRDLLGELLAVGKGYFDAHATSSLRDTLVWVSDTPANMAGLFHSLVTRTISVLVLAGFLVHLSLGLSVMAFAIAPFANVVTGLVARRIRRTADRAAAARDSLARIGWEILAGAPVVHAATAEDRELARFAAASSNERELVIARQRLEQLVAPARELAATTTLLLIAWGIGLFDTGLVAADLFVFVYLVQRMMGPLGAIGDTRIRIATSSDDLARVEALLRIPREHFVPEGARRFAGLAQAIEVRGLTFAYPGREPALRDLTLTIAAGETTAIIGGSGSGKSTLANLLLRFYDCAPGAITVDGVDLRDLDRTTWRQRLAYVGQDILLFDASLRANLCYGCTRSVSDDELWSLLGGLCLADFARALPDGLDTPLGECGRLASGGQQQRIAVGQALLREADVTILDEATSALDEATARAVMATVATRLAGKTVIVIGHRPEQISGAHHVIELAQGAAVAT